MANGNRASGRQEVPGSSGSGRQPAPQPGSSGRIPPATRTSGRGQVPQAAPPQIIQPGPAQIIQPAPQGAPPPILQPLPQPRPVSARLPVQPAANAVPVARPSSRQPVASPSGRMAPAASTRPSRRLAAESGAPVKKRIRGVGKELMICFAVLSVLAVVAVVLGVIRSRQKRDAARIIKDREEAFEHNMKLGLETYQRAENAGLLFVMGKEQTPDEKLFGPFKNDDKVYNIIFDRVYKDKKNNVKTEQKAMFVDRLKVESVEHGREENGIRINYGLAENKTVPIVIARKPVKPAEGDSANLGGNITIIARAEPDEYFEKAKTAKSAAEKEKEKGSEPPK